jgi:hypothetical protein
MPQAGVWGHRPQKIEMFLDGMVECSDKQRQRQWQQHQL